MGSSYTNITLRTDRHADVVAALGDADRDAFVSRPDKGCIVVYDKECEDQDAETLKKLAKSLSAEFKCPALAVLNHDDDILMYMLHDSGKLVDEYNSSPAYFDSGAGEPPEGGDASVLCRAFGVASTSGMEEVLQTPNAASGGDGFVFEHERHEALVESIRTPMIAVGTGYTYLENGEFPEDTTAEDFTRV